MKKLLVVLVAAALGEVSSVWAAETQVVECRGFGRLTVSFEELAEGATRTTFTAATPELAQRMAAKRRVDLLSYGDIKDEDGLLALDGVGYWQLSVTGKILTESFSRTRPSQPSTFNLQPSTSSYPPYLDCFDRYGMAIWLGGGGTGYKVPEDFEWLKKMDFAMCPSMSTQDASFAPGEFDTSLFDWYEAMSVKYGLPWRLLLQSTALTWVWNYQPLPYVSPMDERFVGTSGFYYPSAIVAGSGQKGVPGAAYEPYLQDILAKIPEYLKDSHVMGWHGCEELPNANVNWLAMCAKTPGVVAYYHEWLRTVEKRSLADLGTRYFGDAAHYRSWDDVAVPTPLDFLGHDPARDLDLFGEWEISTSTNGAATWVKGLCNDAAFFTHRAGWGVSSFEDTFLRRRFVVPKGADRKTLAYLHLASAAFSAHFTPRPDVWINGVPCAPVSPAKKLNGDWAHCFDVGAALKEGENEILVNSRGNPIPGFAFLGGTRLALYPHFPSEGKNLQWYDACNFGSWLRVKYIENRVRAYRSSDPNRPIKLMAIHSAQDLLIDLCRRYGLYQHDTGVAGGSFAPYSGSYLGRSHGFAWSCEQAGPPADADDIRRQMSFYLNYGNDAVDAVFAVAHYTKKPDVKAWVEENRELLRTFGKMHLPEQPVAVLHSARSGRQGFHEHYNWDIGRGTLQSLGRSFVYLEIPDLYEEKTMAKHPIVWDAATELMLPEDAKAIRRYAEAGGTFVAIHHTGRHLPERADAWPFAAEFGLTVKDKCNLVGENIHRQPLGKITFAKDETLFPKLAGHTISGSGVAIDHLGQEFGGGVGLKGVATAVATWDDDGTMAVAEVRVGKGRVVFLGSPFLTRSQDERGVWISKSERDEHLESFLEQFGSPRQSRTDERRIWATPWESKNGVYDIYLVTHMDKGEPGKMNKVASPVSFARKEPLTEVVEMGALGHPKVAVTWKDGYFTVPSVDYEPMRSRVYAAPRADAGRAALRWIRNWCEIWHPVEKVDRASIPFLPRDPDLMILRDGWENGVKPALFGTLGLPETAKQTFRTTVRVPEDWKGDRVMLMAHCEHVQRGFAPYGEIRVNGEGLPGLCPFKGMQGGFSVDVTEAAKGGSLVLEVMIDGAGVKKPVARPSGAGATFMLRRLPKPSGEVALTGPWYACENIAKKTPVAVGEKKRHAYFETTFEVPAEAKGKRLYLSSPVPLRGLILNNRIVNTSESMNDLEVTKLVKPDGPNLLRRACADLKGFYAARSSMVKAPTDDPLPPMRLWWR